jgi:chromosomal replication initiation ATPase DnaA
MNKLSEREVAELIKEIVCIYFEAPKDVFVKKTRKSEYIKIKHTCCFLIKRHTLLSSSEIAEMFNLKNHSSIFLLIKKIEDIVCYDKEAKKELKELLTFFMERGSKKYNRPLTIESKAMETILNYSFPGNIRELENLVTRFFALCNEIVTINDLPEKINSIKNTSPLLLSEAEKNHIHKVYEMCEKNAKITSRILGISYTSLQTKLKQIYKEK